MCDAQEGHSPADRFLPLLWPCAGVDGRRDQRDMRLVDLSLPQCPSAPSGRQESLGRGTPSNQLSTLFLQVHDQGHHFLGYVSTVIATGRSCPRQVCCALGNTANQKLGKAADWLLPLASHLNAP